MSDCVFCKIVNKEITADLVHEDDKVVVFNDIHPKAPVHMLVVPKDHTDSLSDTSDQELLGHLLATANLVATQKTLAGYKVVINVGKEGGQVVPHLHVHVLGGRQMEE